MELITLKTQFIEWMERVKETWQPFLESKEIIKEHEPGPEEHLNKARQEWLETKNYFNNVSDPELVDHASYLMRAAESKYMYLLKQYKKNGQLKLEEDM